MKKIFLAGPFKGLVNSKTHLMSDKDINQFSDIIQYFEDKDWEVHCAHKREKWGRAFMTPAQCTLIDYQEIRSCDFFIAFPGIPASPGTHIEIGWASAMKKNIILLLEEGEEYAFLVQGLGEISHVKVLRYDKSQGVQPEAIERIIEETEAEYELV